jgi:hypothetical protein
MLGIAPVTPTCRWPLSMVQPTTSAASCTGREDASIAGRWTEHPHVRVLREPVELDAFEQALSWLGGAADDTSGPTGASAP